MEFVFPLFLLVKPVASSLHKIFPIPFAGYVKV